MPDIRPPADDPPADDIEVIEDEVIEEAVIEEAVVEEAPAEDVAAAESAVQAKAPAKAAGSPSRRRDVLSIARWGLRAALAVVAVACLVVALAGRGGGDAASAANGNWAVTLTLADGPNYGDALVLLGSGQDAQELADDAAIQKAVVEGLAARSDGDVLILSEGGVPLREIDRVQRLVTAAFPAGSGARIHVGLNSH